jgi:hypothetical protein
LVELMLLPNQRNQGIDVQQVATGWPQSSASIMSSTRFADTLGGVVERDGGSHVGT